MTSIAQTGALFHEIVITMHVERLSDEVAELEYAVSDLLRSLRDRLGYCLLLLLRHHAPLTLLQLQIRRLHWRLHWRVSGHDEGRGRV